MTIDINIATASLTTLAYAVGVATGYTVGRRLTAKATETTETTETTVALATPALHPETETFVRLYNSGLTIKQVADKTDWPDSTVHRALKNSGITLRPPGVRKGTRRNTKHS